MWIAVHNQQYELSRLLLEHGADPNGMVESSGTPMDQARRDPRLLSLLRAHGVAPQRLLVELTETSAVADLHDAQRFIEALRQAGCRVSLDDFGTGFSSFAYLKYLHVDSVKIDGIFIRSLPSDYENQLFVKAIVSVARGLHKTTIAEGVEDDETLTMLRAFGVDCVQGYLFERPHAGHAPLRTSTRIRAQFARSA